MPHSAVSYGREGGDNPGMGDEGGGANQEEQPRKEGGRQGDVGRGAVVRFGIQVTGCQCDTLESLLVYCV